MLRMPCAASISMSLTTADGASRNGFHILLIFRYGFCLSARDANATKVYPHGICCALLSRTSVAMPTKASNWPNSYRAS